LQEYQKLDSLKEIALPVGLKKSNIYCDDTVNEVAMSVNNFF